MCWPQHCSALLHCWDCVVSSGSDHVGTGWLTVGASFTKVASGLGSDNPIERLSSAALLRRFFDPKSQYGMRNTPFASDATKLAAGVLKTEPTGPVQKILADGLAESPLLEGADLQKVNLRNAYWGKRKNKNQTPVHAPSADFFHADLSSASFRHAFLPHAVFYGAQLVGTVFENADLTECIFRSANLRAAKLA